jgi:L-proline---[L-prolyl-carrier protein] ligase
MGPLLQHLLIASAQRAPDAEAVRFEDSTLQYGELETLSDRLASTLVEQGIRPGDRVAIYGPKSPGSLIALHGILKAGAAYVPLDPYAPVRRVARILSNCGARWLVAAGSMAADIRTIIAEGLHLDGAVFTGAHEASALEGLTIRTVAWADVAARRDPGRPDVARNADDLAYILYTSGSTGTPKGVMLSHANALAFVDWACTEFAVASADRLSSHAPLHFDLSVFDVFASMKAGAAVALVPDGTSTFPIRLAQWIAANRITIWYSVPSILTLLLLRGRLDAVDLPRLRLVLFAGEVFPVKYLAGVMRAVPHAAFANLYGPTETNVITCYRLTSPPEPEDAPIPIGRPCSGAEIAIVDGAGAPIREAGATGELQVFGPTVASGYWDSGHPASGFVESGTEGGARRAYRTGDIVTIDADGRYHLVGRRDRMIKSRGYRIELDEIETTMMAHPSVREAAVVALPDELTGNRIVGFVAAADRTPILEGALREHCLRTLPRYMVPETFVVLDDLPKTSTGKIDRVRLTNEAMSAR